MHRSQVGTSDNMIEEDDVCRSLEVQESENVRGGLPFVQVTITFSPTDSSAKAFPLRKGEAAR